MNLHGNLKDDSVKQREATQCERDLDNQPQFLNMWFKVLARVLPPTLHWVLPTWLSFTHRRNSLRLHHPGSKMHRHPDYISLQQGKV